MHVKQTAGAQILSAKYNVGDNQPEFELKLNSNTLNEVVAIAKDCLATQPCNVQYGSFNLTSLDWTVDGVLGSTGSQAQPLSEGGT